MNVNTAFLYGLLQETVSDEIWIRPSALFLVASDAMVATITVTEEPPQVRKDADGANCFTRSKVTTRTPPQAKTRPAPVPKAPEVPKRLQERTCTPFDAEDEELSGQQEPGHPTGPEQL